MQNAEPGSSAEIHRVFKLQREHHWVVKGTSAQMRKQKLQKLKEVILTHAEAACEALHQDLRKSPAEAQAEVQGAVADIDDALIHLDEWMKPVAVESSPHLAGTKATVIHEPRGVCLLFSPWNFPFLLLFQPLVPIIAAGNCTMIKPNEMAPATSRISARIVREAFDERDAAVLEGGIELANALLELPFDHVFFTGSPKVGRTVMAAAAKHLASVTLELGGKCPAVIDGTVDLAQAAATVGTGRYWNAGQVCLCPDIVWVPKDRREEFVAHLRSFVAATYYLNGELNKQVFGKIVDGRNLARVRGYLDDAVQRGAKVAFGGEVEQPDCTIHPTALIEVPRDATILREEVFGPILVVMTYQDPAEIAEFMRGGGKPLALYVFSNDQQFIDRILLTTSSGGVTINGWATHWFEPRLPFGGVNESGIGRYHGVHGFKELSHERAILAQPAAV